ncbi:MAG: DUF362 domain-containing protein [Candidatus Odinarchaeota archaeon]|nr:DUF362 domain-containing protein [Candidatus Odinarchaeota archaeon]
MPARIYVSKTENRREFITKILNMFSNDLRNAERIFVKPNLVSIEPYPTTTHPETLDCVLEFLTKLGKEVVVGDGPAFDFRPKDKIFREHPLVQVARKYNVPFLNLYDHEMKVLKSERGYKIKMSTVPLQFDYIIALPVLKTHFICKITCALKNIIGYFSTRERIMIHTKLKRIDRAIGEANSIIRTNLHIVDAIITTIKAQEIRHGGEPVPLGYMFAGTDPVALDSFGLSLLKTVNSELANLTPEDIPHIRYSYEIGLGDISYETIAI